MRKLAAALTALVTAAALVLIGPPGPASAAPYVPQGSNRSVLNFNTHWLFSGDVPGGAGQAVGLDESGFVPVTLPYFRTHPHKGFPKGDFEAPASWYRRHFTLPAQYSGRRIAVEFQGVAKVADVYVNGTFVGQHKGAYTSFTYDITPYLNIGGADNVIAVKVDSMTRNDIPPEGGAIDYYVWGGIVRDVNMIVTDPVHVDWTYLTTPNTNTVNARTRVRNDSAQSRSVTVVTQVVDATNNVVATGTATQTIGAQSAVEFAYNTSTIANPTAWHPDRPYLYTVYTQVRDGSTYVDEHKTRIGIRSIQFNKSDGKFYINGQALKLRGLNRHESYPYIGRAAPNRLQAKDADIIKYELGANIVRTSHYPQDPEFLDRADEIGLLVMEEIPGWQHIGNTAWQDIAVENVREMVMRDRNHPSVVLWGVRINESGDNHNFYTRTNNLARQLDPSRPTGGVRNFKGSELLEDVYTYNDFSGTAEAPTVLPWLVTEAVGHTSPHKSWDPEQTQVNTMRVHLNVQNTAAGRSNMAGALGWAAFDYNTTFVTPPSCQDYTCYHGVSDIFRIPKIAAAAYASQRDPALYGPYVSIASQWTPGVSSGTVYVGGNCQQVELFVNGASRGRINPNAYTSLPHPMFQFTGITVSSGQLRADCWIGGQVVATDTRHTPGAATRLTLTADDSAIKADGGDMTRVVVRALDSNNQVVPTNSAPVSFSVTGPGAVVGESPLALEAGTGAVYVKSALGQTGAVTLTASAPGLTSANVTVNTTAFTDPIVPAGAYTFGFPVDVNDRQSFVYAGSWQAVGDNQTFSKDYTRSGTAGDTATLTVTGNRVVLFGVQDPSHGSAAVSVDGGPEQTVSFQASARRGNVALFNSGTLTQGQHVVRVRVVGNGPVALDRATVVSAAPAVVAPPPPANGGNGQQGTLVGAQSNRCVDVPNSTTTNGTQVQLFDCGGGSNQRWTYTASRQLQVYGNKCLDAYGQGSSNGTTVVIWDCNGGSNQQWNVNADGTITGVASGLCLDASGAATANGTKIVLWSCNGGANQRWSLKTS